MNLRALCLRTGHTRSIQVGQFYHASDMSAAVAKIEWHPWGEAGSTLMVMTIDGKLRYVPYLSLLKSPSQRFTESTTYQWTLKNPNKSFLLSPKRRGNHI